MVTFVFQSINYPHQVFTIVINYIPHVFVFFINVDDTFENGRPLLISVVYLVYILLQYPLNKTNWMWLNWIEMAKKRLLKSKHSYYFSLNSAFEFSKKLVLQYYCINYKMYTQITRTLFSLLSVHEKQRGAMKAPTYSQLHIF